MGAPSEVRARSVDHRNILQAMEMRYRLQFRIVGIIGHEKQIIRGPNINNVSKVPPLGLGD